MSSSNSTLHFDHGRIFRHEVTPEGFLRVHMRVARAGELRYRNDNGSDRIEYVSLDTLRDKRSGDSLKMKPVTLEHPPVLLDASNARDYQRGMTGHMITLDGDFLGVVATITDRETIDAVNAGIKEVSCGYTCEVVPRSDGRYEQRNRQYNHVAIVRKGRAGPDCRVHMDSGSPLRQAWWADSDDVETLTPIEERPMSETFQIDINGVPCRVDSMTYQAIQAHRADTQQRIDELTARLDAAKDKGKPPAKEEMPEEEEMMEEEEVMDSASSLHRRIDALEGENEGLRDLIEVLRSDAKKPMMEEDMEEEDMEDPEEEEYMDSADLIQTWELTRDELLPAIDAKTISFDSLTSPVEMKRAYLRQVATANSRMDSIDYGSTDYINARFDAYLDRPSAADQLSNLANSLRGQQTRKDGDCGGKRKKASKPLTYGGK